MNRDFLYSLEKIYYTYPGNIKSVFSGLSLHIESGVVTAILGKNGCGKSTLLKLLLGVLKPDSGTIKSDNFNFTDRTSGVAFLPQTEFLGFDYSVWEYVLFGRVPFINYFSSPKKYDYNWVSSVINELGLQSLKGKKINQLSGGEFQRVRIARAFAQNPRVLLLDEPTTYLDLYHRKLIIDSLKELHQKGVSIIFATHDPMEAANLAENFILLYKGRGVIVGKKDVLNDKNLSDIFSISLKTTIVNKQLFVTNNE